MNRRTLAWLSSLLAMGLTAVQPRPAQDLSPLIRQYRGTGAEAAVERFASLRTITGIFAPAIEETDPWEAAAVVTLYLEAGLRNVGFRPGDTNIMLYAAWGGVLNREGHGMIDAMVGTLVARARGTRNQELLRFCRDFYLIHGAALMLPPFGPSSRFAAEAKRQLSDDPLVQLMVGAYALQGMGPRRLGDGPLAIFWNEPGSTRRVPVISAGGEEYNGDESREAELALRKALSLDPMLVEARLRLGRVYQLLNRRDEAQRELLRAAAEVSRSDDPLTAYLAELFLGQFHEDAGRLTEAEAAYARATAAFPPGYAARLARGQALIALGRASEGWTVSQSVFAHPAARDPWSRFPAPNYWRITDRLAAMRARVSATPLMRPTGTDTLGRALILSPPLGEPTIEPKPRATQTPVFRANVDAIRVNALVTLDGRAVPNLKPSDFIVSDNGTQQRVDSAAVGDAIAAAIVIDTSLSSGLGNEWPVAQTALSSVRRALVPADSFSLVTASDRLALRADLLREPDALTMVAAAFRPETQGATAVWDAIFAAGSLVAESAGTPLVVLISDGYDNASWFHRRLALRRFDRLGFTIDGIAVPFAHSPSLGDVAVGDVSLRALESSGGMYFDATDQALSAKLADRFAALRHTYVLSYTPQDVKPQKDGWHEIKVTLRPGLKGKVQSRPGYYAPVAKK